MNISTAIILMSFLCLIYAIIFCNQTVYCMIFERDDYKKWQFVIKNIDTFEISGKISEAVYFVSPLFPNMELICWTDREEASLHSDHNCVLCSFYKKASKKVYNLLKNKYNL